MSNTAPKFVVFPYSLNRRAFLAQAAAAAASTMLWSCGGGSSSSAPSPTPIPTAPQKISITSITPPNPVALTPIAVQVAGLDPKQPFTISFGGQAQQPAMRVDSSTGAIIVAAPLNIDATTGSTAPLSTTLTITQNGISASSPIQISDIPQLSDLGVPLGTISRAFLNYQAIILGQNINAQQAISLLPKAGNVNNGTLLSNLKTQLLNVIRARNDVDRVVTNNAVSIPVGTTPTGGVSLTFDVNSVTMMDRVLAQYLLAGTNNGTVLPQRKSRTRKHAQKLEVAAGAAQGATFWTGLTKVIVTEGGAISYLSNWHTQISTDSTSWDKGLSQVSMYSSYVTAGATLVGLASGATAAAPVLAVVATAAAITGFLCGSVAMATDIYNVVTNVSDLLTKQPGASGAKIASAFSSLVTDGVVTYLNAEGLGGVVNGANASISLELVNSIYTDIFKATADSTTSAMAQLVLSSDNLLFQVILADSNTAESSIQAVSPSDFGLVTGMVAISNSQGPILSGLSGVGAGNNGSAPDALTSMATPNGSYELVVPLGSPDLTYNAMDIAAFDPVDLYDPFINTLTILGSSSVVDLSGVNPNTPIAGPSFVGACNDADAGSPDGDDPDCD